MKYGALLIEKLTESGTFNDNALITLGLKLHGFGLDINKLPRAFGVMGPKIQAQSGKYVCVVESVRDIACMGSSLKHMDTPAIDARVLAFIENAKRPVYYKGRRVYKTLLRSDNSKMDSTITNLDRARCKRSIRTICSTLKSKDCQ